MNRCPQSCVREMKAALAESEYKIATLEASIAVLNKLIDFAHTDRKRISGKVDNLNFILRTRWDLEAK